MPRGDLPALVRLDIADDPDVWRRMGFVVADDATTRVGEVTLHLTGAGDAAGITGWGLDGPAVLPAHVDGIATAAAARAPGAAPEHPNGASRLDHVVVATPDLDRTLAALQAIGLQISRLRDTGLPGPRARQAFVWSGDVILEIAGPQEPGGDGPASLWGLVVVTDDIDALPARTDQAVSSIRGAVQPGRRIAPVRREAGSTVPLAFMTPHLRPPAADQEPTTA
jgi:hypothetical protein